MTALVICLLIIAHYQVEDHPLYPDEEGKVENCIHASVTILEKWYIESNETYVFNTSTAHGHSDSQGRIIAHVVVSETMFNGYEINQTLTGWICNDERIAISQFIEQNLIHIVGGDIGWIDASS